MGLTPVNFYYCKKFYLLYNQAFEIFPQVVEKFKPNNLVTFPHNYITPNLCGFANFVA